MTRSDRESELMVLIAAGHRNAEIAASMYLSLNTIKTYIRSAYRKMGVETRTQAVIWALEHGVAPTPIDARREAN